VRRDLRRAFLHADLWTEIDPKLYGGLSRFWTWFGRNDRADAHVDAQEIVESDLEVGRFGAHRHLACTLRVSIAGSETIYREPAHTPLTTAPFVAEAVSVQAESRQGFGSFVPCGVAENRFPFSKSTLGFTSAPLLRRPSADFKLIRTHATSRHSLGA
jgi:hypothetical protein